MDLKALEVELQDPKYTGMTTQQKADDMMIVFVERQPIVFPDFKQLLLDRAVWNEIKRLAIVSGSSNPGDNKSQSPTNLTQSACILLVEPETLGVIDVTDQAVLDSFTALSGPPNPVLEQDDIDAINDLADVDWSTAKGLGYMLETDGLLIDYIDKVEAW